MIHLNNYITKCDYRILVVSFKNMIQCYYYIFLQHPKLFDGINIHISGNKGWEQFSLEELKKLVVNFGAKLLTRMPKPDICPNNIIPFHCRTNKTMHRVSNIVLYTTYSDRLVKYDLEHLKTFHISWFIETVQKYSIL